MNKEEIDNEHLESLEVFMGHHYIADNGHYQWVKKRFKELQQENQQLKSVLNEVREHITRFDIEYLHETMEHTLADTLVVLLEILDKVGGK